MNKMKGIYVYFRLVTGLFYVLICTALFGCSSQNRIPSQNPMLPLENGETDEQISNVGLFGEYELNIDFDNVTAELLSKRNASIGESLMVNGRSFFTTQPCRDCFSINRIGLDGDNIVVGFHAKHPMKPGDPAQAPSNINRLDLDVFDLALLVRPKSMEPTHFTLGDYYVYDGVISNADAYTRELQNIIDDPAAIPYVLVVDDSESDPPTSTFNKFAMGAERDFDVLFPIKAGESLNFELYLTFAYGVSATLVNRLNPVYYNPEFNRKPAWKIEVIPPNGDDPPQLGNTWDDFDDTTTYNVQVKIYDWQVGANVNPLLENTDDVKEISEVFYIEVIIPWMHDSPPSIYGPYNSGGTGMPGDPLIFNIPIANQKSLLAGEYRGLVRVLDMRSAPKDPSIGRDFIIDSPNGLNLNPYELPEFASYQTFTAYVVSKDIDFNPVDVTPPWLNFSPRDIFVEGDSAYIAGEVNGLHIFNISNPFNPIWVNWVDTPGRAYGVYVSDGYAYIADYTSGLQIIDIDPLQSASIVKSVDIPGSATGVVVSDGYAYLAVGTYGLYIIDIDPIVNASIVKTVDTHNSMDIAAYVSNGNAYVAYCRGINPSGLMIIDIDPPESAEIVKEIYYDSLYLNDVYVSGGYAYVANGGYGLEIIDIEPPETADVVKSVNTFDFSRGVFVSEGYAYVACAQSGLQIVDIEPPESASIVKSVKTPGYSEEVYVSGGFAYLANFTSGLQIIDVDPLETANMAKSVETPGWAVDVCAYEGYAFVANLTSGLQMIDIKPPESSSVVKYVDTPSSARDVYVSGGYAYVADGDSGLQIIDIEPFGSASIVKSIYTGYANEVYTSGSYAYVTCDTFGLQIIDVEPIENASIVKSINTSGGAIGVYADGGYAYIAAGSSGLQIIDVDPIDSAKIVKSINTSNSAAGVQVSSGYAFVVFDSYPNLDIIDVDPIADASIVKSFDTGCSDEVFISGGYAYVTSSNLNGSLVIIDISPIENASIVESIDILGNPRGVHVADGYAYIVASFNGLRIIKLW